ncbi:hypothetical protein CMUS01_13429 [Colletotrichum musicola]|uniref:Uncharacterized protein n=1 Tax=Colletotrichum musicola TaxID=2175873 RepID=A0A8H6JCJ8_9PEZI|nr:hypothetical protein CMUS01_13429 [Colletotrichum musicola]
MLAFAVVILLAWSPVTVTGGPVDISRALLQRDLDPSTAVDYGYFSWDPKDPPLWTIRPEDREIFEADREAYIQKQHANPCEGKEHAARLYRQYVENDCPAKFRMNPDGSCQGWENYENECASFCQIRTYFEWASEVPFPNSACRGPSSCSVSEKDTTNVGWAISLTGREGKAARVGVSGGLKGHWGTSPGRSKKVDLRDGQCGYFTWVPVRKVACGTVSLAAPARPIFGLGRCDTDTTHGAKSLENVCGHEMWRVRDDVKGKDVPDGTLLFVYTDCQTREPLPMDKQDPVYTAPGVALDSKSVQSLLRTGKLGSAQSTCSIAKTDAPGQKRVTISGWGFSDDKIGSQGGSLLAAVQGCVRAAAQDGAIVRNSRFDRHKSEDAPDGSLAEKGAVDYWKFSADVPADTTAECVNEVLLAMGGSAQDRCTE